MNSNIQNKCPRIYFTGVGGQGTLTATRLLAQAAMLAGIDVIAGEVHGMAQRGGVVESALLMGGWRAPRLDFGEADIILGFEPLETLRALPYLAGEGVVFSSSEPIPPLSVNLGQAEYPEIQAIIAQVGERAAQSLFIPIKEMGKQAGAIQSGNTALLGAVCAAGVLPVGIDHLKAAIHEHLPPKIQGVNLKALELGAAAGDF